MSRKVVAVADFVDAVTKQRSVFEDRSRRVNELTADIKSDLQRLTGRMGEIRAHRTDPAFLLPASGTSAHKRSRATTAQPDVVRHCDGVLKELQGGLNRSNLQLKRTLEVHIEQLQQREERSAMFAAPKPASSSASGPRSSFHLCMCRP